MYIRDSHHSPLYKIKDIGIDAVQEEGRNRLYPKWIAKHSHIPYKVELSEDAPESNTLIISADSNPVEVIEFNNIFHPQFDSVIYEVIEEPPLPHVPKIYPADGPMYIPSNRPVSLPFYYHPDHPFIVPEERIPIDPFQDVKFGSFGYGRCKSISSVNFWKKEVWLNVELKEGLRRKRKVRLNWNEASFSFWYSIILCLFFFRR
jgi:hypothetical protein